METKSDIYTQWDVIQYEGRDSDTFYNLEDIMLSEISQTQKDKYCMCTYMRYLEQANS